MPAADAASDHAARQTSPRRLARFMARAMAAVAVFGFWALICLGAATHPATGLDLDAAPTLWDLLLLAIDAIDLLLIALLLHRLRHLADAEAMAQLADRMMVEVERMQRRCTERTCGAAKRLIGGN